MIGSFQLITQNWKLLLRVTYNELVSRYAGSLLGIGWAFLSPLLIIAVYAVVYMVIFRVRVPGLTTFGYVLYIFCGLVPFLSTSEALSIGVTSVISNKAVLSNTVFPIDLASPKAVLMSQLTMVVGFTITILGMLITKTLTWTVLLLPLIWFLQIIALIGLCWILSLINVVFRDLQNLISTILMILMVASPIAYTPEMVPSQLKLMIALNPFAYFVIAYQKILVLGQGLAFWNIAALLLISGSLFLFGSWIFPRGKRVIIDYV